MFHIKICGIRELADVNAVADSGADAVGFNFFPPSVRFIQPQSETTMELSEAAGSLGLVRVGVFVNESAHHMIEVCRRLELDAVQLHGDETCETGMEIRSAGCQLIRAVKLPIGRLDIGQIDARVEQWLAIANVVLLDADGGSQHGGSGKQLDWDSIAAWAERNSNLDWVLAGGLTIDNVATAIARTAARSVDVASGVEQPRGTKSRELIQQFVAAATEHLE